MPEIESWRQTQNKMGCIVCNFINAEVIKPRSVPKMPKNYPTKRQEMMRYEIEESICNDIAVNHPEWILKIITFYIKETVRHLHLGRGDFEE